MCVVTLLENCPHQTEGEGFSRHAWSEADRLNSQTYYQQSQQQQHWLNNYQQLACRSQQSVNYQPSLSSSPQQQQQQQQPLPPPPLQHSGYGRGMLDSVAGQNSSSAAATVAMFQSFTGLS